MASDHAKSRDRQPPICARSYGDGYNHGSSGFRPHSRSQSPASTELVPRSPAATRGFHSSIAVSLAQIKHKLQEDSLRRKIEVLGARNPRVITMMVQITSDWFHQGRYREVEPIALQIVQFRREILGALHPDTLKAMYDLARTVLECGRYQESEAIAKQVVEDQTDVLGERDASTLRTQSVLGESRSEERRVGKECPV